ncbi:radical SAM protein [Myxococcaceae bacterium JPH2]|nr:radical SAM protein [Myxococcaceae bacterium JPH2]
MTPLPDWRPHALDGALLWFHPSTGTHVRIDSPGTRHLRRRAPRLVLFGITNACNLTCGFCSRDRAARSDWTPDSAFEVLAGLARAGTLEVAFGGGEPLAFRGFDTLVERLATETPLAIHLTTNGTLLSDERLARLAPHLGEVRVSLYDDNAWEETVPHLARGGVTFGVNVLATPERLEALPAMLHRLRDLGCRDVALLRYVGPEARLHLNARDEARLTQVVAESPLRTRLSVCFGDALVEVPRLFDGDCGAGLDFVTLTSQRELKACSFQSRGIPIASAEDVLAAWAQRPDTLASAAPLRGCARAGVPAAASLTPGVRVWRGFSGNNSGDCLLVGRFETAQQASDLVDALALPFDPKRRGYPEPWLRLLEAEGIHVTADETPPEALFSVGKTVMFYTDMTLSDDFPSLRRLVWKRGGREVHSSVHGHSQTSLAVGFTAGSERALEALEVELASEDVGSFATDASASVLFGVVPFSIATDHSEALLPRVEWLKSLAERHDARLAAELVEAPDETLLPLRLAIQRQPEGPERLWLKFPSDDSATRFGRNLGGDFRVAGQHILIEAPHIGPRLGQLALKHGGTARLLTSLHIEIAAFFSNTKLEAAEFTSRLRPYMKPEDQLTVTSVHAKHVTLAVNTLEPLRVLPALIELGPLLGEKPWVRLGAANPLAESLRRIRRELLAKHR